MPQPHASWPKPPFPTRPAGSQGIPAALTHELAAWRTAVAGGDHEALKEILPSLLQAAATVSQWPDTPEGHRLAAALRPYGMPESADTTPAAGQSPATGAAGTAGRTPRTTSRRRPTWSRTRKTTRTRTP
ncbi:hypothetical protein SGRIM119S_03201 [Streptomyces griseorubiginosus]